MKAGKEPVTGALNDTVFIDRAAPYRCISICRNVTRHGSLDCIHNFPNLHNGLFIGSRPYKNAAISTSTADARMSKSGSTLLGESRLGNEATHHLISRIELH